MGTGDKLSHRSRAEGRREWSSPSCTEGRSAEQGGRAGLTEAPEDFFPERMAKVGPSLFSEAWRATAWVFRDRVKAQHHC